MTYVRTPKTYNNEQKKQLSTNKYINVFLMKNLRLIWITLKKVQIATTFGNFNSTKTPNANDGERLKIIFRNEI